MGDRANVAVIHPDGSQVWLYTHWSGSELPESVQTGLAAAKPRWDDHSYCNKILFGYMLDERDWKGQTGFGICGSVQDGDSRIIVVDIEAKTVSRFAGGASALHDGKIPQAWKPTKTWSFEEFCAIKDVTWRTLGE